jgi:hypothetical protein
MCKIAILGNVQQQDKGGEIDANAKTRCPNTAATMLVEMHLKAGEMDDET